MKGKMNVRLLPLVALIGCITFFAGIFVGWLMTRKRFRSDACRNRDGQKKMFEFYQILTRWNYLKQQGAAVSSWLEKKGVKTVAIYGMRELGELLFEELKQGGTNVCYGIDRDADSIITELEMVRPDDELKPIDAVIVTAIHYYDEIEKTLKAKGVSANIYSLEDILYEMEDRKWR